MTPFSLPTSGSHAFDSVPLRKALQPLNKSVPELLPPASSRALSRTSFPQEKVALILRIWVERLRVFVTSAAGSAGSWLWGGPSIQIGAASAAATEANETTTTAADVVIK